MEEQPLDIAAPHGTVPALLLAPPAAEWLYVLGHGAGAGMRHGFMERVAHELAQRDVATLRYEFSYMAAGARRTDPPERCHAVIRAACERAASECPRMRLVAGGKSFGGRMTSQAQALEPLPGVRGLVFLGFPLHPAKRPSTGRADHLADVRAPMLFLQGTRDDLAELPLITGVCAALGGHARLHVVDGADHSFAVLRRSGRTAADVHEELTDAIVRFTADL